LVWCAGISARIAQGRDHDQRKIQLRKAEFREKPAGNHANSPEVGEAKESLAINYKGAEMAIAFNPKYMIDPLNALSNDEVFIELIDELSPGVLKLTGRFFTW